MRSQIHFFSDLYRFQSGKLSFFSHFGVALKYFENFSPWRCTAIFLFVTGRVPPQKLYSAPKLLRDDFKIAKTIFKMKLQGIRNNTKVTFPHEMYWIINGDVKLPDQFPLILWTFRNSFYTSSKLEIMVWTRLKIMSTQIEIPTY